MRLRTWHLEGLAVASALATALFVSGRAGDWLEWVAWAVYFLATGAASALVRCAVFLLHPLWRRWYRARKPWAH